MGTVSGNWITGTHSGRACHHENIYTKVNKKTGKCYSVKLCNPYQGEASEDQIAQRTEFGLASTAISTWIKENKVATGANNADYLKVKKAFDRQTKYATLRGMMYAKGMYSISGGVVTVDITKTGGSSDSDASSASGPFTISLSASPANGGTVTGAGSYEKNATATIKAEATSGYHFNQWSDGNTSVTRTLTVTADKSLTAIFVPNSEDGE